MNDAMQSLGYGLLAVLFSAAILALCAVIKKAAKNFLKGGQNHDDKQTAHRHGS